MEHLVRFWGFFYNKVSRDSSHPLISLPSSRQSLLELRWIYPNPAPTSPRSLIQPIIYDRFFGGGGGGSIGLHSFITPPSQERVQVANDPLLLDPYVLLP